MNEFITCDRCNGSGFFRALSNLYYCGKCKGTGRLTWLENIFGKIYTFEDNHLRLKNEKKLKEVERL
jgi:DnaJ-class molecular chaperone